MQKRNKINGKFETLLKDKVCPICNKTFHPRLKNRKTCSKKCGYKYRTKTYRPTKETLEKRSIAMKNIERTKEWKDKISKALKGKNNGNWRGGISYTRNTRRDRRHHIWRKLVFERDDYTCQNCKARNGNGKKIELESHHIKPFAYYPKLRYKISNGLTLCKKCHKQETTKEMKKNWVNQFGNGKSV